ncbi:MAG: NAD(P)-dependent oxidoreductase, partial [Desulfobacterales bacterium]|jgi:D-3-phosphoglycerate dehydrogenase|nr:NAD(P)-dependent oxidoreductase [Desulfobacterales bacterium]
LQAVVRWGKGYENVDVDAATRHGILVSNQGGFEICVAEAAVLLMLALSKKLMKKVNAAKKGIPVNDSFRGVNMADKTLGIVGLGIIGGHTANICKAIGMRIIAFDPYCEKQRADGLGIKLVSFEDMLKEPDFISISCNYTEETHHLFDKQAFERMKPTAFIVNTARGAVIDENALINALQSGSIAGAGLDVVEKEPIDTASPLLAMENVVVTPHALAVTLDARRIVAEGVLDSTIRVLQNELPKFVINQDAIGREK